MCQDTIPLLKQAPLVKDVCNYRRVRIAIYKISYRDIIYIYAVDFTFPTYYITWNMSIVINHYLHPTLMLL